MRVPLPRRRGWLHWRGRLSHQGAIKTARYGWVCAECYDQLEAAWKWVLAHRDEIEVVDKDGNFIA
jgi:hypothetical protein